MLGKVHLISRHGSLIQFLCSFYRIDQQITEPTRVTPTPATSIDLILTNKNLLESSVIHLGISDSSCMTIYSAEIQKNSQGSPQFQKFC